MSQALKYIVVSLLKVLTILLWKAKKAKSDIFSLLIHAILANELVVGLKGHRGDGDIWEINRLAFLVFPNYLFMDKIMKMLHN